VLFRPVVILSLALPLVAADDALPLLARVSQAYKDLKTFRIDAEDTGQLAGEYQGSWRKSRWTLAEQPPNRIRFETAGPSGSYAVVSDGKTLWRANVDLREFSRTPVAGPPLETPGGGAEGQTILRRAKLTRESLSKIAERVKNARFLPEETVELDGKPVLCAVVRAEYDQPPGVETRMDTVRTFWIDKARNLIVREERTTTGNLLPAQPYAEVENRATVRYTHISVGEPLPDSLFTYKPPPGFGEVGTLETISQRSAAVSRQLIGKPAPDVPELAAFHGKVVLLDFWATWCAPCLAQIPTLSGLYRELKEQGLVLVSVNDDETPETAARFRNERGYDWPDLFDGKSHSIREAFKVRAIPTLVVIDKNWRIVEYQVGAGQETEKALRVALSGLGIEAK
jgi:thiol-disulfide isomerase/thioredoxin